MSTRVKQIMCWSMAIFLIYSQWRRYFFRPSFVWKFFH